MSARVARLCPPGKWWYIAVCEECHWSAMSWRDRSHADKDRDMHNDYRHANLPAASIDGSNV